MNPQDMTVFITGATAGFGIEAARRFVRGGARVIATGRRQERLDALKKELGDACHVARLDVTDYDAVKACVDSLPSPFNEISVLINNAGLALGLGPAHKANMDEWRQMLDTNVNGVVHCTHVILPGMVARNRGHIINVGSVGGRKPNPGSNIYGATKAFVHLFSKNLRAEVLGSDVRVTCLEPGIAESEFNLVRYEGDKEKADAGYKGLQPITSSEIAEVMFFCVSLPDHININVYQLMPVMQADSGWQIHRRA